MILLLNGMVLTCGALKNLWSSEGGGVSFKRNFNAALVGEYNRVILIVLSTEVIM